MTDWQLSPFTTSLSGRLRFLASAADAAPLGMTAGRALVAPLGMTAGALIGPQRIHRIDAQRPTHRNEHRDERVDGEQQHGTPNAASSVGWI